MGSRSHNIFALVLPLTLVACAPVSVHGFNGEGLTGIVWQNLDREDFAVWHLNQTSFVTSGRFSGDRSEDMRMAAVADFNRDGNPDLFWNSPTSGANEIWLMHGTDRLARHLVTAGSPDFEAAGAGDFNGDGYPDILWRDPLRNVTAVWFMEGPNWRGQFGLLSPEPQFNWIAGGIGDFNHDGNADIVWRDRYSGRNLVWLMRGTELLESVDIRAEPDLGYRLVGTGSFSPLGNMDLLWRHSDGRNLVWLMSGAQYSGSAALPTEIDGNWTMVGTGGYTNVMRLSAVPDSSSANLTLRWYHGTVQPLAVERREVGRTDWDVLTTHHIPSRFTDQGLTVGQRYEYRVGGEYLLTGIAAAPIEDRGKIILVVEAGLAAQIPGDIELLKTDLAGDGWSVVQTNVVRHDDADWSKNLEGIASIKSFITNIYFQDPARLKSVYLLGHIPIPYSGFHNPDGHGGRALPADLYYGDVDGIYTDSRVNFISFLEGAGPPQDRHANRPGDGKYDQNRLPANAQGIAELELAVGRADFSHLPSFGALSEAQLTQRYIRKTHRYRHKQVGLPERVVASTFFPVLPNLEAYGQAIRIGSRLFGIEPGYLIDDDPFDPKNSGQVGILGAFGLPGGVSGRNGVYHQSADLVRTDDEPRIAFAGIFASFLLDFPYADNFMRAFLATPTYGLSIVWFRPVAIDGIPLAFEQLGLGETIGSGFVRSINQSQPKTSANTYVALLGDPTLRLQVVPPPTSARLDANITLEWSPSSDTNATYLIYQSTNRFEGPWLRYTPTPVAGTNITDFSFLFGRKMYQVRAAQLVHTGSGSYTNLSQGVIVESQ